MAEAGLKASVRVELDRRNNPVEGILEQMLALETALTEATERRNETQARLMKARRDAEEADRELAAMIEQREQLVQALCREIRDDNEDALALNREALSA